MAKPKVLATHRLFEPARKILQEQCEVEYWEKPERPPREEVLLTEIRDLLDTRLRA